MQLNLLTGCLCPAFVFPSQGCINTLILNPIKDERSIALSLCAVRIRNCEVTKAFSILLRFQSLPAIMAARTLTRKQPGAREGEVESWMGHLVWPNQFKPMPLLPQKIQELLYTSAFWKSIRDLQGTLVDKGRFPENLQKHHQWKTAEQLTHTDMHTVCSSAHVYIILLHCCII